MIMLKKIGFGVVAWAIPYVTSLPLLWLMFSDRNAFQTIMIVEGSLVGAFLACQYFRTVERAFLREGLLLGLVWVATSWFLDFVALVPFADITAWRYFVEIGFRYLAMFAPTVAIGYTVAERQPRRLRATDVLPKAA
jgi:hypothetical protein